MKNEQTSKFPFGQVVTTPGADGVIAECENAVPEFLAKHGQLEQGLLSDDDQKANVAALKSGARIFSSFKIHGEKVWIITEADRSATTFLLPEEY
jgi:hypothetical protein